MAGTACGGEGQCPECNGSGFAAYEGGLPQTFAMTKGGRDDLQDLPSDPPKDNPRGPTRNWRHPSQEPVKPAAPADGAEKTPEAPEPGEGH